MYSSAARMSESSAPIQATSWPHSKALKTGYDAIRAPGATPEKYVAALGPLPAAMPATCVAWKQMVVKTQMTPEPGPVSWGWPWGHSAQVPEEKHASSAIRP